MASILKERENSLYFTFGKYEGLSLEVVAGKDQPYLRWLRKSDLMAEVPDNLFEKFDEVLAGLGVRLT